MISITIPAHTRSAELHHTYGHASPRPQHLVASNGIAEDCAKEHIRGEVSTGGYAGKTDCGRKAVHHPRHPAVSVVASGNDRGYSKSTGGVSRWKAASFEG